VRGFYLTNADVKQTAAMIRAIVKTRDLYIDEKLNLLVMRDTRTRSGWPSSSWRPRTSASRR